MGALAQKEITNLEETLGDYIKLPFSVSRFLKSQERDEHQFEEYFKEKEGDGDLLMRFTPGITAEGPPGHCHGGFVATFLDECMGGCAWWNAYVVLAGNLNIKYRKPVPLNDTYYCVATVERVEKRRVYMTGKLYNRDGVVMAEGTGVFIRLPWEKFPKSDGGQFNMLKQYLEMRDNGTPFAEIIEKLNQDHNSITPPA